MSSSSTSKGLGVKLDLESILSRSNVLLAVAL